MTTAPKEIVDFIALIDELRRHGFSERVVADKVGVSQPSVHDYRLGAIPQFHVGERLVTLWCGVTNRKREDLPTTRHFPSASKVKTW